MNFNTFLTIHGKYIKDIVNKKKQELIDEIITMDWYDLQGEDDPKAYEEIYRKQLVQLPIEVLQRYIDDEITSEDLYDNYISQL